MKQTTMLMILDGFGSTDEKQGNAIAKANTPQLDTLFSTFPHTTLGASGMSVGLPTGQMGNSEVGHLNMGAGRIVYQELTKITKSIDEGTFFENEALLHVCHHVASTGSALHLMGLLSDGGVHSHLHHCLALLRLAKQQGITQVYIHALLDGRDVPPRSARTYINALETEMATMGIGQIATIGGRYYAMDRDNRWDREQLAYDAFTLGMGQKATTALDALSNAYARGENDEFVLPTVIMANEKPIAQVNDGDGLIFFNFRPDRARQITRAFVDPSFDGFIRKKEVDHLHYVCLTQYDAEMPHVQVAFPPQSLKNTLGEYVAALGLRQLRIAETEKYAHVTFFFNGGIEAPNNGEDRILVDSPKVATYDLQPEMSAFSVADRVVEQIRLGIYDLIILNFANCDMVGHTGIMHATVSAVEAVDTCVGKVAHALLQSGGRLILTADHGNADCMSDPLGNVVTAHSLNPVPFLVTEKPGETLRLASHGILADIAPTLLHLMGLAKPEEMTGESLIHNRNNFTISR